MASAFGRRSVIDLWPIPKHLRTQSPHARKKTVVPWVEIPPSNCFFKTIGFYCKDKYVIKYHANADNLKFLYTSVLKKVVGKNVHATIPKGNMGYNQYTVFLTL